MAGKTIDRITNRSMGQFLDTIEETVPIINLAQLVGHGSVRIAASDTRRGPISSENMMLQTELNHRLSKYKFILSHVVGAAYLEARSKIKMNILVFDLDDTLVVEEASAQAAFFKVCDLAAELLRSRPTKLVPCDSGDLPINLAQVPSTILLPKNRHQFLGRSLG